MGIFEDLELLFHSSLSSDSRELYQWLISKRNSPLMLPTGQGHQYSSNCCLIIRNCPHFVFISLAVPEVKDRHSTSCSKIAIWPSNGRNQNLSSWAAQGEVKVQLNFWSLRCHRSLITPCFGVWCPVLGLCTQTPPIRHLEMPFDGNNGNYDTWSWDTASYKRFSKRFVVDQPGVVEGAPAQGRDGVGWNFRMEFKDGN